MQSQCSIFRSTERESVLAFCLPEVLKTDGGKVYLSSSFRNMEHTTNSAPKIEFKLPEIRSRRSFSLSEVGSCLQLNSKMPVLKKSSAVAPSAKMQPPTPTSSSPLSAEAVALPPLRSLMELVNHTPFNVQLPPLRRSSAAAVAGTASLESPSPPAVYMRIPADEGIAEAASPNRRQAHIASEQKRRQHINDGFEDLRNAVPDCKQGNDSKAVILRKSLAYIRFLEHKIHKASSPFKTDLRLQEGNFAPKSIDSAVKHFRRTLITAC